jgi:RND family efflux transporter MFP subunit
MTDNTIPPDSGTEPKFAPDRRRLMSGLGAACLGVVLLAGASTWTRGTRAETPPSGDLTTTQNSISLTSNAPQWALVKLGVAGASAADLTDPVPARVVIDEARSSKIGLPLAGRVTSVFVELGQRVREGDRLFSVASPDIADLRAAREKAAVELDAARAALERVKAMVASRSLPAKEELAAERDMREAEVSAKLADAKLQSLRVSGTTENEFTVIAPRSGVVVEKNVLPGQTVSPDSGAAMQIADLGTVWVVADLFEADASNIREGAEAQVTSPSIPDLLIEGRVEMVSSMVDPERHTVPIRVRLSNADGALRPNVFARVRFGVTHGAGAVEVPASALVTDGEHQYVYVQSKPGTFTRQEVVAGSAHDGRVPVVRGLQAGDTVVVEGAILLDNQISLNG